MPGKLRRGKLIAFTFAASGAALTALWAASRAPEGERSAPPSRHPAAEAAPAPLAPEIAFLPQAGFRYTYSFRRSISFAGNLGGGTVPPVAFAGMLHLDVLRADARSFEALVSESIEGAPSPASPLARIETPARGDRLALLLASPLGDDGKQHLPVVKDLLSLWLFPLHSDTVGPFTARIEALAPEGGFPRARKAKLSYLAQSPNTPAIVRSGHYLLWDRSLGLPREVKGEESTRLGQGEAALLADSRYELRLLGRRPSPAFSQALLSSFRDAEALSLDTSRPPSMAEHPDYARLDWGDLLSKLRDVEGLSSPAQLALFGDILRFLRLHPERAADLAARLRDPSLLRAGADSALFRTLVGALATAGGPAALAALRDAYDDPHLADPGRSTLLAALTTTQAEMDAATRDFLARKMQSERDPRLSQAAAFALGSALQGGAQDAAATQAIEQLRSAWQAAKAAGSVGDQLAILDAMGNSGRAEFLSILLAASREATVVTVRARALYALRFVKDPAVPPTLIAGLAATEAPMREASAGAIELAAWTEGFRAPLERCASQEPLTRIQESCRKSLADHGGVAAW